MATPSDPLAAAVRASWEVHAAAIQSGDDLAIARSYLATLRAELAIEEDCLLSAWNDLGRRSCRATIDALTADIEDAAKNLATLEAA